jgi:hypothetical protein
MGGPFGRDFKTLKGMRWLTHSPRAPSDTLPIEKWMDFRKLGDAIGQGYKQILQDEAGSLTRQINEPVGKARGMVHAGEGLLGGINFLTRLLDETDAENHTNGDAAWDQVIGAGRKAIDYAGRVSRNPGNLIADVDEMLTDHFAKIDPYATPTKPAFSDELARQAQIGRNQGEDKFNQMSAFVGGMGVKAAAGIGAAKPLTALDYARAGYRPRQIADFESLYRRPGHHAVKLKDTEGWPEWVRNNPFFMVAPPGITKGRMYQLHFGADKDFHGAKAVRARVDQRVGPVKDFVRSDTVHSIN